MSESAIEPGTRTARRNRVRSRRNGPKMWKALAALGRRDNMNLNPELLRQIGASRVTKGQLADLAYLSVAAQYNAAGWEGRRQANGAEVRALLAEVGGRSDPKADKRATRKGEKMMKAAWAQAVKDARRKDDVVLTATGALSPWTLQNVAKNNLSAILNPQAVAAATNQQFPAGQQVPTGQQTQAGQAPPGPQPRSGLEAQIQQYLQMTAELEQRVQQIQVAIAELSAQMDQLREIIASQNPQAQRQQAPAPVQENSGQTPGPENTQATPEAGGLPQPPVAAQGAAEQTPPAVDPAAVDPAAVDPAAVDPAAVDPAAVDPAAVDAEAAAVDPTNLGPDPDAAVGEQLALDLSGEGEVEVASEAERLATNQVWVDGAAGKTTPAIPEADGEVAQQSAEPAAAAPEQGTRTTPPARAGQASDQGVGPDDTDTRATPQGAGPTPALDPDVAAAAKVGLDGPAAKGSTRKAAAETAANSAPATNGKSGHGPATTKETKPER